ncbi:MAG: hypothetical protein WDW38_002434 [Sanguina aurantia]
MQVVLSFHACGGNVGDTIQVPLPGWVLQCGESDPDLFFTDRPRGSAGLGQRNREYLSVWADDAAGVICGRSPMQCYEDFMVSFKGAFEQELGSFVEDIVVGSGPCGELRFPAYVEANGWKFPGVGEFQCYDRRALASLAQAAREAGHPEWGYTGPHNAGTYNSLPEDCGFFAAQGSWDSPYGRFFLSWYSSSLIRHGDRLLDTATSVFASNLQPRQPSSPSYTLMPAPTVGSTSDTSLETILQQDATHHPDATLSQGQEPTPGLAVNNLMTSHSVSPATGPQQQPQRSTVPRPSQCQQQHSRPAHDSTHAQQDQQQQQHQHQGTPLRGKGSGHQDHAQTLQNLMMDVEQLCHNGHDGGSSNPINPSPSLPADSSPQPSHSHPQQQQPPLDSFPTVQHTSRHTAQQSQGIPTTQPSQSHPTESRPFSHPLSYTQIQMLQGGGSSFAEAMGLGATSVMTPMQRRQFRCAVEMFPSHVNTFGQFSFDNVSDYKALADATHARGGLVAVASDLLALTLIASPGEWGADIVVGNSQRFGVPFGNGGPHAAFMACRDAYKRSMPGRLIGVSIDAEGKPAYRLTLQTREQHIRREKATSNICTAQVLLAVMASMYAVYHGPDGLTRIASRVHRLSAILASALDGAGITVGPDFFDTLHVLDIDADAIHARAASARLNLRRIDSRSLGISLDETTTRDDVIALAKLFGAGVAIDDIDALDAETGDALPAGLRRTSTFLTHPVFNTHHSEHELLRYMRSLADKDLAMDRTMIPLGSCTMKLNATAEMIPVTWPEFGNIHPLALASQMQGYTQLIESLEAMLVECTGYDAVSLQPNSGAQGEYAGLLAIRRSNSLGQNMGPTFLPQAPILGTALSSSIKRSPRMSVSHSMGATMGSGGGGQWLGMGVGSGEVGHTTLSGTCTPIQSCPYATHSETGPDVGARHSRHSHNHNLSHSQSLQQLTRLSKGGNSSDNLKLERMTGGLAAAEQTLSRGESAMLPALRTFTFLRLGPDLVQPVYQKAWVRFMQNMASACVQQRGS